MTSQPLAYSSSSSSNIKHTPGLALAGRRIQARTNSSKRRLSDLQEMEEPKLAKTSASGAVANPAKTTTSPCKRERRSLFEECQDRLADKSGASDHAVEAPRLEHRLMPQEQCEPSWKPLPATAYESEEASMAAELGKLGCSGMSCSKADLLRGVIGYGSDPAQITSPVKRTPLPEVPADDGFHRTFQPFDMLKSPTSLGGHSFQDLNAHLAQNARLSTRQRSLRHALRTATKEYVIPEEPALPDPAIVMSITGAPAGAAVQPSGGRPLMVNVSRGAVGGSTTLVSRSQGSGFISINRMPEASTQSTSQGVPIRRCIF
ncbi:hypothetical protein ABBQ32_012062 [Trebouxia sp. C0010 RCD-2024]